MNLSDIASGKLHNDRRAPPRVKYLGTAYEGTRPIVIWHHCTGHDDSRDWATFTHVKRRLTTGKVLNRCHPEILFDMHKSNRRL